MNVGQRGKQTIAGQIVRVDDIWSYRPQKRAYLISGGHVRPFIDLGVNFAGQRMMIGNIGNVRVMETNNVDIMCLSQKIVGVWTNEVRIRMADVTDAHDDRLPDQGTSDIFVHYAALPQIIRLSM